MSATANQSNWMWGAALTAIWLAALSTTALGDGTQHNLSGFYGKSQADCLKATGTLYLCEGSRCAFQEYISGGAINPKTVGQMTVVTEDGIDNDGVAVQAGDLKLTFRQLGSYGQRILRITDSSLLTTYSARTDARGEPIFFFIKDGVPVDPSATEQNLMRCSAYDSFVSAATHILDMPSQLQSRSKIELPPRPPEIPSLIPFEFESPVRWARIHDVIPVTMGGSEYPALFVFWVFQIGGKEIPLQVLSYDSEQGKYVDNTEQFFKGAIPELDYPRGMALFTSPSSEQGLFIANIGLDGPPFPRAINTLLLPTSEGRMVDMSYLLPQSPQFSHDVSAGIVDHEDSVGIYVNDMYIPEYYILDSEGTLHYAADDKLPNSIHRDGPKFLSSELTDVNGDGLADLVLGAGNQNLVQSQVLLNDGFGGFDQSAPIPLPISPIPDGVGEITGKVQGASILDITALKPEGQAYSDLVVVSSNGYYEGYAIQILVNDGTGHFFDKTADRIDGELASYFHPSETPFSWIKRAWVFERDGVGDIITQSAAPSIVPSVVFKNDGTGHFEVATSMTGGVVANAAFFGGVPMLIVIEGWDEIKLMDYPSTQSD